MSETPTGQHILLVDDDADLCLLLDRFLKRKGYRVETAGRKAKALELLKKQTFDLILCDHRLPDGDSLEMLGHFRQLAPDAPVIVITGYSDVRIAVDLMRRGAHDYVVKPLYPDDIAVRIEEALQHDPGPERDKKTGTAPSNSGSPERGEAVSARTFVHGVGPSAKRISEHIRLVAPTDLSVLITGETGTGKEFVAREIHRHSKRAKGPFVAVDCGAIPGDLAGSELFGHVKGAFTGALMDKVGCFKQADGGTLFLDEVGNLSPENQMKLLRVLQERVVRRIGDSKDIPVDVRIIAATNEDLGPGRIGHFREDLFHRLNEFRIELLPLRARQEDILHYADHFLQLACERLGRPPRSIAPEAGDALMGHAWPGNLRELNNVIKRAVLLSGDDPIGVKHLPAEIMAGRSAVEQLVANGDLRDVSQRAERQAILNALEQNGYNKTRTAAMLHIDRKTLYNKLKAFGIDI
ncbi:MAG: sigma-54-dependent Fis family transcriptional regulator [Flavobacteriales bacterium]|nr:sigma-54-dependent Fis family transcriptional regulator [Flavobacteriales bacterium]MCB9168210.1 sigma-54-dependent Fis family transcriptional regulator [Flavobacteriales bacterium]